MAKKIALLIGVGDYGPGLAPLHCPGNGVAAMQAVLGDPTIGGFDEVEALVNPGVWEMRSRICEVFARTTKRDLVLFYFTGHGIKDMTGDFYLTTAQTQLFENGRPNAGTAVEAPFLKREASNSLAERKVIILDCCFGAAFADGFLAMNDSSVDIEDQLGGKGWCVLTASTSARYALERKGAALSVYTYYLVEGLKTGSAAPDGQQTISAGHLHEYIKGQVKVAAPAMEPAMFNRQQGYDIVIARAQVDSAQRYRAQLQARVHEGQIGPAGRAALEQWRQRLGVSAEYAVAIENEVLHPFRERQRHLAVYAEALVAERGQGGVLGERAMRDLKDLQRLLGLCDEDVCSVEKRALGQKVGRSPRLINNSVQRLVWRDREKPTPPPSPYSTFRFETVQVNGKGELAKKMLAEATTFTEDLGNGVSLEMVKIPGGQFWMGAAAGEDGANEKEQTQREMMVPEFWIGKYAVTRAQWNMARLQLSKVPADMPSRRTNGSIEEGPNRPVENVFWTDAVAFCQWLSVRSHKAYKLPSGAQWEYACRAGTTTPFYFGETITPALVNYNGNYAYGEGPKGKYRQQTTDVGNLPPNLFGLYDMHGNVWEWCLDGWPDFHSYDTSAHSAWKLSGQKKFLRGGSWSYLPTNCRSAYSLGYPFHDRIDDIGFRVVCQL